MRFPNNDESSHVGSTDHSQIKKGLSLLGGLQSFYDKSPLMIKRNLISSIFPNKLIFEKKHLSNY